MGRLIVPEGIDMFSRLNEQVPYNLSAYARHNEITKKRAPISSCNCVFSSCLPASIEEL